MSPVTLSSVEAVEALERHAASLAARYRRATWYRFVAVFFPVPFVVVLLRLQLEGWHYFLAGGAYLGFSAMLYVIDGRASDAVDRAQKAAEDARRTLTEEPASSSAPSPGYPGYRSLRA